jgi:hypothetical protein
MNDMVNDLPCAGDETWYCFGDGLPNRARNLNKSSDRARHPFADGGHSRNQARHAQRHAKRTDGKIAHLQGGGIKVEIFDQRSKQRESRSKGQSCGE